MGFKPVTRFWDKGIEYHGRERKDRETELLLSNFPISSTVHSEKCTNSQGSKDYHFINV
jgi:hypothetical protein